MLESRARGGGRGRRDEPGVPARHRPGARRAGAGRDAQVPRPAASTSPRLYPLGALTRGLKGEELTEMARAHRSRLRRLLAGRRADARHAGAARARCSTRRPSATRCGCARTTPGSATASPPRGALATRLGLSGVPVLAETIALRTIFELVRDTGARVHLCRLSSAAGVELVRKRQGRGAADHLRRQHPPRCT